MAFRPSQFGRFGSEVGIVVGFSPSPISTPSGIDAQSASLLGNDTPANGTAEDGAYWLDQRGYPKRAATSYLNWRTSVFPRLVAIKDPQIGLLRSNSPRCEPVCIHEFLPSTLHKPLVGWFDVNNVVALDGDSLLTNVMSDKIGRLVPAPWTPNRTALHNPIGRNVKIIWIIDQAGEILVTPEQLLHVKHSSLAAGCSVWAAGEMGFQSGKLRVINFSSGHYLSSVKIVGYKTALKPFVEVVFQQYNHMFLSGLGLSPAFEVDDT
jgi:hypothetical protein